MMTILSSSLNFVGMWARQAAQSAYSEASGSQAGSDGRDSGTRHALHGTVSSIAALRHGGPTNIFMTCDSDVFMTTSNIGEIGEIGQNQPVEVKFAWLASISWDLILMWHRCVEYSAGNLLSCAVDDLLPYDPMPNIHPMDSVVGKPLCTTRHPHALKVETCWHTASETPDN